MSSPCCRISTRTFRFTTAYVAEGNGGFFFPIPAQTAHAVPHPLPRLQGRPSSRSPSGILEIDPPPERGEMDIGEVMNSPFFFS